MLTRSFQSAPQIHSANYELAAAAGIEGGGQRRTVRVSAAVPRHHVCQGRHPPGAPGGHYHHQPPTFFGTMAAVGFFAMSMGFTLSICSFIVFSTSRFWASTLGRGGLVLLGIGSLLLTVSVLHHCCKPDTRKLLLKRVDTLRTCCTLCCRRTRAICCPVHLSGAHSSGPSGHRRLGQLMDDCDDSQEQLNLDDVARRQEPAAADGNGDSTVLQQQGLLDSDEAADQWAQV